MRRLGENSYYKELLRPKLNEILGETSYKLEHINGKRRLVIQTDRVDDDMLEEVKTTTEAIMPKGASLAQYNHHIEVSWRDIGKYDKVRKSTELKSMTTKTAFQNDLTSDGWWVYPMSAFTDLVGKYHFNWFHENSKLKVAHIFLPNAACYNEGIGHIENLVELVCVLGTTTNEGVFARNTSMRKLKFHCKKNLNFGNLCNNCTSLSEVDITWDEGAKVSGGAGGFSGCILNKESVIRLLNSLPEMAEQSITTGIHIDHQYDDEVLEAIANAEAKGWTLTVQWNGTQTTQASATYGLRKPPIYAKVAEIERSDGTVEQYLDWGHYVTNPEDYQEFSSLEEARDYFNLPEDSEELNKSEQ